MTTQHVANLSYARKLVKASWNEEELCASSIPISTVVVDAMRALNEEIYQTCVHFVEGLERTAVFLPNRSRHKSGSC